MYEININLKQTRKNTGVGFFCVFFFFKFGDICMDFNCQIGNT